MNEERNWNTSTTIKINEVSGLNKTRMTLLSLSGRSQSDKITYLVTSIMTFCKSKSMDVIKRFQKRFQQAKSLPGVWGKGRDS